MKNKLAAFVLALAVGPTAAVAQSVPPPDVRADEARAEDRIAAIVRSTGLSPIMRPIRRGSRYVVQAVNGFGKRVRVIVDAHWGEARAIHSRSPWRRSGPYAASPFDPDDVWSYPPRPPRDVRSAGLPPPPPPAVLDRAPPIGTPDDPQMLPPPPSRSGAGFSSPTAALPPPVPATRTPKERSPRSAAVTPANPPLPKARPDRGAEPAPAAPATEATPPQSEAKAPEATPDAAPARVILPGGPQWTSKTSGKSEPESSTGLKQDDGSESGASLPPVQSLE